MAHRWLKRISYLLAGGALAVAGVAWFAQTPTMQKVYIRKIASAIKNKTGLDFGADGLNFNIFRGQVQLVQPYLDTDLFKAENIIIAADIKSFFGDTPRLRKIVVTSPVSNINQESLQRIKIAPSDGPPINWVLDELEVYNGNVFVNDASWGSLKASFNVHGTGSGPQKLRMGIDFPSLAVSSPKIIVANKDDIIHSNASAVIDLDVNVIKLQNFNFSSDLLKFQANCIYDIDNQTIQDSSINGSIFTQYLLEAFGADFSRISGQADFDASLMGEANNPRWKLRAKSGGIKTPFPALENCRFALDARGGLSEININDFQLSSSGSSLSLRAALKDGDSNMSLNGNDLPLAHLTKIIRTPMLEHVSANFSAAISSKAPIDNIGDLSQLRVGLSADFKKHEASVGNLVISAENNLLQVKSINLNIPEINLSAEGDIAYNANLSDSNGAYFTLTSINMNTVGDLVTSAEQVASVLDKWNIVERLPISGATKASAKLAWSPSKDLQLDGKIIVNDPVYYGATADNLAAGVRIASKQLFLDDILLNRNKAKASGGLWLTWDQVPEGKDEIIMRYDFNGIPLSEGLETGISDTEMLTDMAADGLVDGWVTIQGPLNAMQLEAKAELYGGSVYGVSIPALSCSLGMDLAGEHLSIAVREFALANSRETLVSLDGPLALKGSLDIDLTDEIWNGSISGLFDTNILGIASTPQTSGQIQFDFNGPYVADFGSIKLPEGTLALTDCNVIFENNEFNGLMGNIALKNGQITGTASFSGKDPAVTLSVRNNNNNSTSGTLNVAILPRTADTKGLALKLTNGALEDIEFSADANVSLNADALRWWANIDTFAGRIMGLDFRQQNQSRIQKTAPGIIQVQALNLESFRPIAGGRELRSQFSVSGAVPLNDAQRADLTLLGTVDLEQAKNTLARVFNKSDDFLAGYTPLGLGQMDFRLQGPYPNMELYGDFLISEGELKPRGDFPYGIDKMDIHLKFDNRRVLIDHVRGIVFRGGKLDAYGEAAWNNDGIESYRLKTDLKDFHYNYKPEGFQFGGSLDAVFHNNTPNGNGIINGKLTLSNMEYVAEIDLRKMIFNNTIGDIPTLQTVDLNDPLDNIGLDLDIDLLQPWVFNTNLLKVRGNNKPSEQIRILGTLANPGLGGGMDIVKGGRITNILPAGDMVVESGTIDFPDPNELNPVLNIHGQIDITPFRVNLSLQGSLDSLSVVVNSTPTLRQDEIFALLLNPALAQTLGNSSFNGNSSTSAGASTGLAETVTGIVTNLALTSILEQVRRTLLLDRVNAALRTGIGGGSATEMDIIIGKNIEFMDTIIPITGSYKTSGGLSTIGGQMELRFGGLVIHFGATGSRALGIAPSGEIRYSWSPK